MRNNRFLISLLNLILFIAAIYLCWKWFGWKMLCVILMFQWSSNISNISDTLDK